MSNETLEEAATTIKKGGLVAYPTDTVYGLGCDPFNAIAVMKVFEAKQRGGGAIPLLVDSLEEAEAIGALDEIAYRLASIFWPGPLTIVVPAKAKLPSQVTGSTDTVGLRIPRRSETIRLITAAGGALTGTSANIAGNPASRSAEGVLEELDGRIDLILDGGQAASGIESSVVKVESGRVTMLREKAISIDKMLSVLSAEPQKAL